MGSAHTSHSPMWCPGAECRPIPCKSGSLSGEGDASMLPSWPLTPLDLISESQLVTPDTRWAWRPVSLPKGTFTFSVGGHEVWGTITKAKCLSSPWGGSLGWWLLSWLHQHLDPHHGRGHPSPSGSPLNPIPLGSECLAFVPSMSKSPALPGPAHCLLGTAQLGPGSWVHRRHGWTPGEGCGGAVLPEPGPAGLGGWRRARWVASKPDGKSEESEGHPAWLPPPPPAPALLAQARAESSPISQVQQKGLGPPSAQRGGTEKGGHRSLLSKPCTK